VGEDLSLNMYFFTDRPAQTILLNPFLYTATKSPFTSLEITMGQDKIYGWSAQAERKSTTVGANQDQGRRQQQRTQQQLGFKER
jgi:hypothetical protein